MFGDIRAMTVVYLIYGASFLLIALGVALSMRRAAPIRIVEAFSFLALFGLFHGLKEFCDLRLFLRGDSGGRNPLEAFSAALMLISFVLLAEFALHILAIRKARWWTASLPWLFAAALSGGLVVGSSLGLTSLDHYGRWMLGAPSALLSAAALFALGGRFRKLGSPLLVAGAFGASLAFAFYSLFVAWVHPTFGGVPVQLCRAACAVLCAGSVLLMLRGFWITPPSGKEA